MNDFVQALTLMFRLPLLQQYFNTLTFKTYPTPIFTPTQP